MRDAHWYNLNETRPYPLDDSASGAADGGAPLPQALLADLNLSYPASYGRYPFLSAAAVTPRIVTVTLQASASRSGGGFTPLAAASVDRASLRRYATVPLRAFSPGVAGWVVFGAAAVDGPEFSARFSAPGQSFLSPRAARAYRDHPVPSAARLGGNPLTGLVSLKGQAPVVVEAGTRLIGGLVRDCVVFRLADAPGTPAESSAFRSLAGPCAGRPESRSCGDPQPVETVNGVPPDCDGVVTVEFRGCADAAPFEDGTGAVLECSAGLAANCPPPLWPDALGSLPDEYSPYVRNRAAGPPDASEGPPDPVYTGGLPFQWCFRGGSTAGFSVKSGSWSASAGADPSPFCESGLSAPSDLVSGDASRRSVVVWDGFDTTTLYRTAVTDVRLEDGPYGALHNGALVLNWKPDGSYLAAGIEYETQRFVLKRFGGSSYTVLAPRSLPSVLVSGWYRLSATVRPGPSAGLVSVSARVQTLDVPAGYEFDVSLGPYAVGVYGDPEGGLFGFETNRSLARFGCLKVLVAP